MFCRYCGSIVYADRCRNCGGPPVDPTTKVGQIIPDKKDPWSSGYFERSILNDDVSFQRQSQAERSRKSQSMIIPLNMTDDKGLNESNSSILRSYTPLRNYSSQNHVANSSSTSINSRYGTEKFPASVYQSPSSTHIIADSTSFVKRSLVADQRNNTSESNSNNSGIITPLSLSRDIRCTTPINANGRCITPTKTSNSVSQLHLLKENAPGFMSASPSKLNTSIPASKYGTDLNTSISSMHSNSNTFDSPTKHKRITSFSLAIQKLKSMDLNQPGSPITKNPRNNVFSDSISGSTPRSNPRTSSFSSFNWPSASSPLPRPVPALSNIDMGDPFALPASTDKIKTSGVSGVQISNTLQSASDTRKPFLGLSGSSEGNVSFDSKENDVSSDSFIGSRQPNRTNSVSKSTMLGLNDKIKETPKLDSSNTSQQTRDRSQSLVPFPSTPSSLSVVASGNNSNIPQALTPVRKFSESASKGKPSFSFKDLGNITHACSACNKQVKFQDIRTLYSLPGTAFCKDCFQKENTKHFCYVCKKQVLAHGRPWVSIGSNYFHKICMVCSKCSLLIMGTPRLSSNGEIFCNKCTINQDESGVRTPKSLPTVPKLPASAIGPKPVGLSGTNPVNSVKRLESTAKGFNTANTANKLEQDKLLLHGKEAPSGKSDNHVGNLPRVQTKSNQPSNILSNPISTSKPVSTSSYLSSKPLPTIPNTPTKNTSGVNDISTSKVANMSAIFEKVDKHESENINKNVSVNLSTKSSTSKDEPETSNPSLISDKGLAHKNPDNAKAMDSVSPNSQTAIPKSETTTNQQFKPIQQPQPQPQPFVPPVANSSISSIAARSDFLDDLPSVADIMDFVKKNSSSSIDVPIRSSSRSSGDINSSVASLSAEGNEENTVSNTSDSIHTDDGNKENEVQHESSLVSLKADQKLQENEPSSVKQNDYMNQSNLSLNASTSSIDNDVQVVSESFKELRSFVNQNSDSMDFGSSSTINHSLDSRAKTFKTGFNETKINYYDMDQRNEISVNKALVEPKFEQVEFPEAPKAKQFSQTENRYPSQDFADDQTAIKSIKESQIRKFEGLAKNASNEDMPRESQRSIRVPSIKKSKEEFENLKKMFSGEQQNLSSKNSSKSSISRSGSSSSDKLTESKISLIMKKLNLDPQEQSETQKSYITDSGRGLKSDLNASTVRDERGLADNLKNTTAPSNTDKLNSSVADTKGGLLNSYNPQPKKLPQIPNRPKETPPASPRIEEEISNRRTSNPLKITKILKSRPSPRLSNKFIKETQGLSQTSLISETQNEDRSVDPSITQSTYSLSGDTSIPDIGSASHSRIIAEILEDSEDEYTPPNHCTRCKQPLSDTWFNLDNGRKIHPECFTCPGCTNPIQDGIYVIGHGKEYHPGCLPQSPPVISIEKIPLKNLKRSTTKRGKKTENSPVPAPRPSQRIKSFASLKKSRSSLKGELNASESSNRKSSNSEELLFSDVESDYGSSFTENDTCDRCHNEILGPRFCLTSGKLYHPECFICAGCKERFEEGSYISYDGLEYHHHCVPVIIANDTAANEANNMSRTIQNGQVSASVESIDNRDVDGSSGSINSALNYTDEDQDQDEDIFCFKCNKVIDGVFAEFNDLCFHPNCFSCIDCGRIITPKLPYADIGLNGPCCKFCLRKRFPTATNL
ncbi:hypothetical protein BB560_001318 [Smittium megazygosporum]|uniref:LIM zinc-binding domain-containing protein n=1 Tax=Smittium megazygosporum TaxID=133381 RepID=A0A2T9ZHW6_9FUNG|nr:hypothetical protein BB560_001318 [Smittium megazygosporum]